MELAFYIVNFGYTKDEYRQLSHIEKMAVMKTWENKHILETTATRDAFLNAYSNANRKKGKAFIKMFAPHIDVSEAEYGYQKQKVLEMTPNNDWVKRLPQSKKGG